MEKHFEPSLSLYSTKWTTDPQFIMMLVASKVDQQKGRADLVLRRARPVHPEGKNDQQRRQKEAQVEIVSVISGKDTR